jgi:hypothetical protein
LEGRCIDPVEEFGKSQFTSSTAIGKLLMAASMQQHTKDRANTIVQDELRIGRNREK